MKKEQLKVGMILTTTNSSMYELVVWVGKRSYTAIESRTPDDFVSDLPLVHHSRLECLRNKKPTRVATTKTKQ